MVLHDKVKKQPFRMERSTVHVLRWFWVSVGIGSAVLGCLYPSWGGTTNNLCWIAVFLANAPYPQKY